MEQHYRLQEYKKKLWRLYYICLKQFLPRFLSYIFIFFQYIFLQWMREKILYFTGIPWTCATEKEPTHVTEANTWVWRREKIGVNRRERKVKNGFTGPFGQNVKRFLKHEGWIFQKIHEPFVNLGEEDLWVHNLALKPRSYISVLHSA